MLRTPPGCSLFTDDDVSEHGNPGHCGGEILRERVTMGRGAYPVLATTRSSHLTIRQPSR
jgi:hypothetical protein